MVTPSLFSVNPAYALHMYYLIDFVIKLYIIIKILKFGVIKNIIQEIRKHSRDEKIFEAIIINAEVRYETVSLIDVSNALKTACLRRKLAY